MLKNIILVNFTKLNQEEKEMVLSWRNLNQIKKWMLTSEKISLDNHLSFIDNLQKNKNSIYFLIKKGTQDIGVINFTNITSDACEIGLYSNPSLKGMGSLLLESIFDYAFEILKVKKLTIKVLKTNEKALSLYEKQRFMQTGIKKIDDREFISMELKHENR